MDACYKRRYKWNINSLLFIYIHTDRNIGYTTQQPDVSRQCLWRIGALLREVSVQFVSHTHSEPICSTGDENACGNVNIFVYLWFI
jgi:hypothetical protein